MLQGSIPRGARFCETQPCRSLTAPRSCNLDTRFEIFLSSRFLLHLQQHPAARVTSISSSNRHLDLDFAQSFRTASAYLQHLPRPSPDLAPPSQFASPPRSSLSLPNLHTHRDPPSGGPSEGPNTALNEVAGLERTRGTRRRRRPKGKDPVRENSAGLTLAGVSGRSQGRDRVAACRRAVRAESGDRKRAPSNSVSRERRASVVSSVASGIRFAGSRGAGALLGAAACAATPGVLPPVALPPKPSPFAPVCPPPSVRRPPTLDPDTARNPRHTRTHGTGAM